MFHFSCQGPDCLFESIYFTCVDLYIRQAFETLKNYFVRNFKAQDEVSYKISIGGYY